MPTALHLVKDFVNQPKINIVLTLNNHNVDSVIRSEVLMTNVIVQHTLPFVVSHLSTKLFLNMVKDLKITKGLYVLVTICILNGAMMPQLNGYISCHMPNKANI